MILAGNPKNERDDKVWDKIFKIAMEHVQKWKGAVDVKEREDAKPCPLCGGVADWQPHHGIQCRRCGLWLGEGTSAMIRFHEITGSQELLAYYVVVVWNTRPTACTGCVTSA